MPCGWEGDSRSGITLAIHHRLWWFIHVCAHGLGREMSTQPTLFVGHTLSLPYLWRVGTVSDGDVPAVCKSEAVLSQQFADISHAVSGQAA